MAQLRQEYPEFQTRDAEVIAIGPDSQKAFQDFWLEHDIPFIGLADPDHVVAGQYGQQVRLLKGGRMPAIVIVDKTGRVRYRHYGSSMKDIPASEGLLSLLDDLNREGLSQQDADTNSP